MESAKRRINEYLLYASHFILPNGTRRLLNHVMEKWTGRVISVPITDGTGITVLGAVLLKPLRSTNLICSLIQ